MSGTLKTEDKIATRTSYPEMEPENINIMSWRFASKDNIDTSKTALLFTEIELLLGTG